MSCIWPHTVEGPVCVYDRESFEKYEIGEYKLPIRCFCGAEIEYVAPVCICLVENGLMTGNMIMKVEIPITFLERDVVGFGGQDAD